MRILALETATRRATACLLEGERVIASRTSEDPRTHAEHIIQLIDELALEAGVPKASLDLIACGLGPGSFTGVRIALATAKGIALALERPLVGVSSLRAMAAGVSEARSVMALIDAKKGEIFVASYDPRGEEILAPCHVSRAALPALAEAHLASSGIIVGEVASELGLPETAIVRGPSTDLPHAALVGKLAYARALLGEVDSLDALEPLYVRPPDIYPQLSQPRTPRP